MYTPLPFYSTKPCMAPPSPKFLALQTAQFHSPVDRQGMLAFPITCAHPQTLLPHTYLPVYVCHTPTIFLPSQLFTQPQVGGFFLDVKTIYGRQPSLPYTPSFLPSSYPVSLDRNPMWWDFSEEDLGMGDLYSNFPWFPMASGTVDVCLPTGGLPDHR